MSVTGRERSMNLSVSLKELEFNEEHFSRTPLEPCRDRGSRIEGELEELNTYARVLTNLKQRLIVPIQDIILSNPSETPGLKCVKRICSHLIVVEEMIVKFHKYSGFYFKNTSISEEKRIFINCASCLNAIIRAWEEYLLAYAEADAFEAFEEVTKLPGAKTLIESGYAEFAKFGSVSLRVNNNKKLSSKLSYLLLIIHDERASIVVLSNELSISVGAHMEKDESDFRLCCDKLARLTERKRNLQSQVEVTRKFWNEHTKLLNCVEVKNLKKLIILSSRERKMTYTKWGSMNTVGFVLFQDSLLKFTIDFIGNYEAHILPLNLLWVYASKSKPEARLQLQLISPEAHFFLQCNSQDDRDYWVRAINETTIDYLGVPRQEVTNKPSQASSLLWPPLLRNATYTFQSGQYQGAKYSGLWTDGRQHGRGSCVWPDGKTYIGQFRRGLFYGKGKLSVPHTIENEGRRIEVYEGQFEEGLFHGYGVLNYANEDHYEGEWYKGQRQGHGKFVITRDNQYSMFIGEWSNGKRNGFGVENATDAEKSYHGMWKDDIREGQGFTITTGDLYCSCRFRDNVLAGRGFIINGAGKMYEGWLSGAMGLNGTGELRLLDNTVISGTFNGRWSDWAGTSHELKVSNGFISKHEVSRKAKRFDFIEWEEKAIKYSASPEYKWASLFEKCKVVLHLVDKEAEPFPSLSRTKSRKKSLDQDNLNGFSRRSTMNNGRTPLRKCHTALPSQNGIVKPNKNSFEIAVGPVSSIAPSTPVNSFDVKCEYGRERSRSNPEGCRQPQTTPPSRPKFVRTNSLHFGFEASEVVKSECTTPNQSKRSSPMTDKEQEFSDLNSTSLSSPSALHECVYLGSINEAKKSLFDKVNMYFSSNTHALGKLVRDLKDVIFESYAGIGASQYLLPHAISDTKTFLHKLAEIIQLFAPFMMDNDSTFLEENIDIIDSYFISDLFISRIYHTLFTLFSLFQAKNDTQYETTVAILSLMPCSDLMNLFQIESAPSDADWYKESSYILSTISQEYTIQGKLDILKRSVNNMLENLKDSSSEFTTDVIIPYFQIVIVYARVKKLSTELHYIYTFMHPNLSQGEFGFLLTLLEGCYMLLVPEKLPRL